MRAKDRLATLTSLSVLLPVGAALILALTWLGTIRMIAIEGKAAEERVAQSALELLETYEAQLIRAVGVIDQSLKTVEYAKATGTGSPVLVKLSEKGVLPPALVFTVMIADRYGVVRESTADELPVIAAEPYFLHHIEVDDGQSAVHLLQTDLHGHENKVVFSRRLNAPDGSFQGVALIKVGVEYFISGYETARLGTQGLLGLIDDNGVFLINRIGDAISSGKAAGAEFLQATAGNSELILSPWDGVRRYANTRTLYGYPLKITVGLSREEQLQGFAQQRRRLLWTATIGTLVILLVTLIVTLLARQLENSRARTRQDQETYYAASEASLDVVIVLRALQEKNGGILDFRIESINKRTSQLLNRTRDELVGMNLGELAPQMRQTPIFEDLTRVMLDGQVREAEWENHYEILCAKWLYRQVVRIDGGVVLILRDITERKEVEERIAYLAHHDSLTGLLNRTMLNDRLQQALLSAHRHHKSVSVAFLDLDNFKIVNDGLGHKAGDEVLTIVADRITGALRQSDTVVRLGGDEFVILMPDQAASGAARVVQKVCEAISKPAQIFGHTIELSTSIGIAVYPDDGQDSETLLLNADTAMYEAKQKGRNNYQFYTAEMNAKIAGKLAMQEEMRKALERGEFYLLYQPQVNLRTGDIVGVEALVRWRHPEKGTIAPYEFISLAEETGLIVPLGEWVMQEACKQNKAWQARGLPPITMSVNVSAYQFRDHGMPEKVAKILANTGLDPCHLDLELTESLIMHDTQRAAYVMLQLKNLGMKLSIDDFGTGYSSLAYLKTFPISRLKLDRSFVNDLSKDQEGRAIAKAVVALGHELEMEVLAEGVENDEQTRALLSMGFDLAQGYFFGRPSSASDVEGLLSASKYQLSRSAPHYALSV